MLFKEFNEKYAEKALAEGTASKEQIDECMALTDESKNITLERALVNQGVISPISALRISSQILDIPFVDLYVMNIDPLAANKLEKKTCLKYCCLPIGKFFGNYVIVTDCVLDDKEEALRQIFGEEFEFNLALRDEILKQIDKVFL